MKKTSLFFLAIFASVLVFGQNKDVIYINGQPFDSTDVLHSIVHEFDILNENYKNQDQIVLVYQWRDQSNPLVAGIEKKKGKWKLAIGPVRASIGRSGFAEMDEKWEGDGKTPSGFYKLGQLYSYDSVVNTKLPYIRVNEQDKWIDDTGSIDYNKYIRGETTAKSFEHLLLKSIDYKYCMVIEYNTNPIVPGKGSAIFFHVATDTYKPTSGCVAIAQKDMEKFLSWLKPKKQKSMMIKGLIKGLFFDIKK